ncbi:MAG: extracellular solute-binding protein [Oscillospiraceae bacterium]|jgi:serine/threonine protein kinase|nr:extracellular solute-binding protein [Oscillospiraceae bacterium]
MQIRCDNCFTEYDSGYTACPHCGFIKGGEPEELFYLKPGTQLNNRYIAGGVIGFGGFGIIYRVWDTVANNIAALKEYYPNGVVSRIPGKPGVKLLSGDKSEEFSRGKERFQREALRIKEFEENVHIVRVFDNFSENNTAYYAMEFLSGTTLGAYIETQGKMSAEEGVSITLQVASALKALHKAGILHRDISPDNVIIPPSFPEGNVKLIDFGAARLSEGEKENFLTQIMKPGYSPPEQYERNAAQTEQIDIYALGATLYYALTAMKPEEATNRIITDNLPTPKALNDDIPQYLSDIILKAMAAETHLRFRTVADFERVLTKKAVVLTPPEEMKRRVKIRKISALSIAAVLCVGLVILGLNITRGKDSAELPDAEIALWYIITGDATVDFPRAGALKAIAEDFTGSYPNVTVNIKGIPREKYLDEVYVALRDGGVAAVLESGELDDAALEKLPDISGVLTGGDIAKTYFLDSYKRYFPGKNQLPLGFNVSALYINPELCTYEKNSVSDLSEVFAAMPLSVSERGLSGGVDYKNIFAGEFSIAASELFYNGETGAYLSGTEEYYAISAALPARYKLLAIDRDSVPATFAELWSILPAEGAERKVSERLLSYMLNENSQDYLHIRNKSGALPINKNALDAYCKVYGDYEGFFANSDKYQLKR